MKRAVVYIRVSTKEQAETGRYSLSTQKSICESLAKQKGYTIVRVFDDPGKSGTSIQRAGLQAMLEYIRENKVDAVIVQDTDRLARNVQDHLVIKSLLLRCKTELLSATQPTIDSSPEGTLLDTILAAVNQLYSDQNSRKVTKNMAKKAEKGWLPRSAYLGYKNVKDPSGENIIALDEERSPFIIKAYELFGTGNYSVRSLADKLYEDGFRNKLGKRIGKNPIYSLLRNPFYLGKIIWKDQTYNGNHKPLINQETFDKVQNILTERGGKGCRERKHYFLLRGYAYCSCGRRMQAEHHPRKQKSYYCCSAGKACDEPYIDLQELERQAAALFKQIQFSETFQELVLSKLRKLFDQRKAKIQREQQVLVNQRTALEQKRDTAEEKLFKSILSDEDFSRIRTQIVEELEAIQQQLTRLENERNFSIDDIKIVLGFTRDLHSVYTAAPLRIQKNILTCSGISLQ